MSKTVKELAREACGYHLNPGEEISQRFCTCQEIAAELRAYWEQRAGRGRRIARRLCGHCRAYGTCAFVGCPAAAIRRRT